MRHTLLAAGIVTVVLLPFVQGTVCEAQISVLTQYDDSARDGLNANEASLTLSSVSPGSFGKLFNLPVDGYVYAQPLYVANVAIPGNGNHNVVYVATMHDSVYAYDADGLTLQPLWQVNLAVSSCPSGWTCSSVPTSANYVTSPDIIPEIGILSTPVIDPSTNTLYAVAKTQETVGTTNNYVYRLHALDITTGAERNNSPVVIQGQVTGTGSPNSGGLLLFSPLYSLQRPGLTLTNNGVYMGFGSAGDGSMWHGWIFGYDATSLTQTGIFSTTPNGTEGHGGVWMHGNGLASDLAGNLYFTTGNGAFDGIGNFGNAFVKLATPNLGLTDYFAPYNQQTLDMGDLDISSGGVVLLPDSAGTSQHPHIMIGCGKNGALYVLDRDSLGQFNSAGDSQIIQEVLNAVGNTAVNPLSATYVPNCFSSAAYWQGRVYFGGVKDGVKVFTFSGGLLSTSAASQSSELYGYPGASVSISANGASQGIAWTIEKATSGNGVLHAYDATNLANELYNSGQSASDLAGRAVKFATPTIANGRVLVGTQTSVAVYGLLSSMPQAAAPSFSVPGGLYGGPVTITIGESTSGTTVYYTTDGSLPTTSSGIYTGPLTISGTETLSAIALGAGYRLSPVTVASYVAGPPGVTSVLPNAGPPAGGTAVTISGANFAPGAGVNFGGSAASNVTVVSSTQITATTPANAAGAVSVTVTLNGQNGTLGNGFTYVAGLIVASVSPNAGGLGGGTGVRITGTNFATGATVNFGSSPASNVTVVSSTQITATTPANAAGAVPVTVASNGQNGTLGNGFTYAAGPSIASVSPNTGTAGGGTLVTITGANFADGATVNFGSIAASKVTVLSSTSITVTTPTGAAGTVNVTVTCNAQSASLPNAFTYAAVPKLTTVSPNSGSISGGTAITITGTNFAPGATVTVAGKPAGSVVLVTATSITAITPPNAPGTFAAAVKNPSGLSASLSKAFTYFSPIKFVQIGATSQQTAAQLVPVAFPGTQTAGNLNIVAVGWADLTSTVQTVQDSAGNNYQLAISTKGTGLQQSIYYASNIAGGSSNTVTVTFSQAAVSPDVRIAEYQGVSTLDLTSGRKGSNASPVSGSATTTSGVELIFGADYISTSTKTIPSAFAMRITTVPGSNIVEDKVTNAVGSMGVSSTLTSAGPWVMQMAAFK